MALDPNRQIHVLPARHTQSEGWAFAILFLYEFPFQIMVPRVPAAGVTPRLIIPTPSVGLSPDEVALLTDAEVAALDAGELVFLRGPEIGVTKDQVALSTAKQLQKMYGPAFETFMVDLRGRYRYAGAAIGSQQVLTQQDAADADNLIGLGE